MAQPRAWLGPQLLQALGLVELRGVLAAPLALGGEHLRLELEGDAAVGLRLARVIRIDGDERFAFEVESVPERGFGPGLWRITGTHAEQGGDQPAGIVVLGGSMLAGDRTYSIGPEAAARFQVLGALDTAANPALVLLWEANAIPGGGTGDVLWVAASITLAPRDEVSRWRIAVLREEGRHTARIDHIDFPILACRGPVSPRPFESHFDAQRYARIVVPNVILGATPFLGSNENLWFWLLLNIDRSGYHPGALQSLQFSVIYAGDPQDAASFRRMLYLGSEDTTGHYKVFRHAGIRRDSILKRTSMRASSSSRVAWSDRSRCAGSQGGSRRRRTRSRPAARPTPRTAITRSRASTTASSRRPLGLRGGPPARSSSPCRACCTRSGAASRAGSASCSSAGRASPRPWQAGFDPRLYGLGGEEYEVFERLPGGVRRWLATNAGSMDLICDDAPVVLGGDLFLGKMPARSLRVLEVRRA